MFAPANQTAFTLTLDGVASDLKVYSFEGTQALSNPYRFDLELVSEQPDLELESLLHRQAYLGFDDQGHGVHGLVYRVAQGDSGRRLTRYQLSLVPQLAYLKHSSHQRIFQQKTVPQIVAQVLAGQGIQSDQFEFRLSGTYPEREYCVQFGETDLAFVQRLCAELGIHYHFQHSAEKHLLVFGDDQTVFTQAQRPTPYMPGSGMVAQTPAIKRFAVQLETRTTTVNLRDYDFRKPRLELESAATGEQLPKLEQQCYPGHFSDRPHGKYLAQRGLERHRSDYRLAQGGGDEPALVSGGFLDLSGHPREDWNALWLVTQVTHGGRQPQVLEEAVTEVKGGDFRQGYRNEFTAAPWDVMFRPSLPEQPRPSISGYQSAVVTGPADSEVHCDEYGRVKVQMAWDREGKHTDHSSCWLRVARGWAHDRYGTVLIPRVGMEVLVGFVNGDLDMPLVMGCLPNAATSVPLDLPADKSRSIFRSQSTPGGGGYNELRIEDRKGAEEIYLRAQRDWTQHVLHDQQVQVDNQRRVRVGGESHHELQGEEQRITHGNRLIELKQDDHLMVGGSQQMRAGTTIQIGAGQSIVIDAGANVTIQAGGQSITISAGGIFSSVPIQLGGGPAPAAAPLLPGVKEKLLAVIPAPLSRVQVASLKRSAPFCEECERCKNGQCDITQHAKKASGAAPASGKTSGVEPGFHIVQRAMSRDALEKSLFESPSAIVLQRFRSLNPQLTQYARPGQMLVLSDPLNSQCTREEALLMEAAQEVNDALKPMSDDEAAFMVENHEVIGAFLADSSMAVGVESTMLGKHLGDIEKTLKRLEALHVETFQKTGKLQGAEFFAERKVLLSQLDNGLGPLVRRGVGIPDHPKLKSAMGISSRSLVHHWKKAGVSGGTPGYATHIQGVARASQYMKVGGFVGIGLGASASALKVKETCRVGTAMECKKVKFTEGGKFTGEVVGGAVGGAVGVASAGFVCAAIGVGTLGVGGLICGLVVVGAATASVSALSGNRGEKLGEKIYEVVH